MPELVDKVGASVVRTVTPWLVGFAVTLLAKAGLNWKPSPEAFLLASQIVSAAFYTIVRVFETHVSPKFGWLLGKAGAPAYEAP